MEEKKRKDCGACRPAHPGWNECKLRWARELRGMSQTALAQKSGISKRTIESYEQGSRDINLASGVILYRLATALGVTMEQLINVEEV